jgi:selenocysteine-specific elongation factor
MAEPQHFIIASAGHVDHGKSALVKALTGIDPDRLPEEKARGITIDLGFAHLELPAPAPGGSSFQLGIVDVPGHEDFVKNMVAGVGSIDLALIVVAADDGWMPQTEEHLQILSYLGVDRGVVALTKIDLIHDERSSVEAIRDKLRNSLFSGAPIVPTSIITGRGLGDLKSALAEVLAGTPPSRNIGKPRLPVDRVFTLRGIGTVVTGTLTGGTVRCGQSVAIQPSGKIARIRNIQSHNRDVDLGIPGTRTALNLPDLSVWGDIRRGDVVTLAELGGPSEILDVILEISPRANHSFKDGANIRVHHSCANVRGKIAFFEHKKLAAGERALAQLRLEASIFVFAGDHFVLRDSSGQNTLAGGIVLDADADPNRKSFRDDAHLSFLRQRAESPSEALPFTASQLASERAVRPSQLLLKSKFSAEDISNAVSRLAAEGKAVLASEFAVDTATWRRLRRRAADAIEAHHRAHPEQPGLSLSDLRLNLEADLSFPEILEFLVRDLCGNEFIQVGNAIRSVKHQPSLPPRLQAAVTQLRTTLESKQFDPPSRNQLAPDSVSQQAVRFLIEKGELVEINSELVLTAEGLKRMTASIRQCIQDNGPATVSQLRQVLGCSRRVIVPLLERLDREGVTMRDGDFRKLRSGQGFVKRPGTKTA